MKKKLISLDSGLTFRNPLFSLIVPLYNRKQYLNRSLNSIFCQQFDNFEIVVADDCSTDGSYELVQNFSFPKLTVVRNSNHSGTLITRINAVKACKGSYLISMDPDDEIFCDLFTVLFRYLREQETDAIQYRLQVFSEKGDSNAHQHCPYKPVNKSSMPPYESKIFNNSMLLQNNWISWSLCSLCIRKDIFLKGVSTISTRFYSFSGSEDFIIFFSTILFCKSFRTIDYYGYVYYYKHPKKHSLIKYRNKCFKIACHYIHSLWKNNSVKFHIKC